MIEKLKRFLAIALSAAGLFSAFPGWSQDYPSKHVNILVGFPAGGLIDVLARVVGEKLSQMWRQPVVVENRLGASGTISLNAVATSAPDGYTLGMLTFQQLVAGELLKRPFDIEKDLVPIAIFTRQGNVLVVNTSVPATNAAELIAYLKKRPGQISFASGGNGSPAHVAGELFKIMAGVEMVHVPYKGGAPAIQDVVAGRVAMMFAAAPLALPLVKGGKLRALAVTSDTRSAHVPDLPTLAENGINYDVRDWQGLVGRQGIPRDIVAKINVDVGKVLEMPDVKTRIASIGGETFGGTGTPADFGAFITSEITKWRSVVKQAKMSID